MNEIDKAIELLREHAPAEGYYLCFSGGKDSIVIHDLAKKSGVKFTANYNNTTVDPPELVHFIRREYPNVIEHRPKQSMMKMISDGYSGIPPTRIARWCCRIFKEHGGDECDKIIGVRAAESARRAKTWKAVVVNERSGKKFICPIIDWSDGEVWRYIKGEGLKYPVMYDEGFSRLGCVGCPLSGKKRLEGFRRWPKMAMAWERAVKAQWLLLHDKPKDNGTERLQHRFPTAESFWRWYIEVDEQFNPFAEGCQQQMLFTNHELPEEV